MNKIEEKFITKAINRNGIILYSKDVSLEFIIECCRNDIGLLGIDGFFITENTIQPSINNSIDFSNGQFYLNVYDTAIEFIKARNDDLYFEIVCK